MQEKNKPRCACGSADVRVVSCSGGSNVGQIANQAAISLAKENVAGFFCVAGIGAHIKGMVESGKKADLIVSIDGCQVQCAAKTLQHEEIEPAIQIIVTEFGIDKTHDLIIDETICAKVVEKVKNELAA